MTIAFNVVNKEFFFVLAITRLWTRKTSRNANLQITLKHQFKSKSIIVSFFGLYEYIVETFFLLLMLMLLLSRSLYGYSFHDYTAFTVIKTDIFCIVQNSRFKLPTPIIVLYNLHVKSICLPFFLVNSRHQFYNCFLKAYAVLKCYDAVN